MSNRDSDVDDEPVDDATNEPIDDVTDEPVDDATNEPVDDATDKPIDDRTDKGPAESTPAVADVFDDLGGDTELDGESLWDELAGYETQTASEELDAEPHSESDPLGTESQHDPTKASGSDSESSEQRQVDRASRLGNSQATDSEPPSEAVVDKRRYCQQCPFFSEPPEVACSHEGTSIVEVLIDGQFRLRGCPVVTDTGPDRTMLNDEH